MISVRCILSMIGVCLTIVTHANVSFANQDDRYDRALTLYLSRQYEQARSLFLQAAETGDAAAQYNLGLMYLKGHGVEKSPSEALEWFLKSARQGYVGAQYSVGIRYLNGDGVQKNPQTAIHWLKKAAEQGDSEARQTLGRLISQGNLPTEREKRPPVAVESPHHSGNKASRSKESAESAVAGYFFDPSTAGAFVVHEGDARGTNSARSLVKTSRPCPEKNESTTTQATRTGEGSAAPHVARAVAQKTDTIAKKTKEEKTRTDSPDQPNKPDPLYEMKPYQREALQRYSRLAKQGDARSQYNLGLIYKKGDGVPQNFKESTRWFRKAAEQGHVMAQIRMGTLYADGCCRPPDYVLAHKWFNIAAATGNKEAMRNRRQIAEKMTPQQIAKAQAMALEWRPSW